MIKKNLRFPSPFTQNTVNSNLDRFISATADNIHNPWPELVDYGDLRLAWSNPICRTWYVPTTDPEQLEDDFHAHRLPLEQWHGVLHETAHNMFDFSPAKEFVRLYMAEIYQALTGLLSMLAINEKFSRELAAQVVNLFFQIHEIVGEIIEEIYMSEELLVTAFSMHTLKHQISRNPERINEIEELERIEELWIRNQGNEYRNLYYRGFKKVVQLVPRQERFEDVYPTLARLLIFLQPAINSDLTTMTSIGRCYKLTDCIEEFETGSQLLAWLTNEISEEELNAWQSILEQFIDRENQTTEYTMKRVLWALARGRKWQTGGNPQVWAKKAIEQYWNWIGPPENSRRADANVFLYPLEVEQGRWHIKKKLWHGGELIESYDMLLNYESYRQQLFYSIGFHCPFAHSYTLNKCGCASNEDPMLHDIILRLVSWVNENIDDANWNLPPQCRTKAYC